ncbi:MAG TPA: LuxR C-terminal-related transcriptional regulator [Thermoleophilaceae bacterium]|nr:LuxR C-terminal-related transcriptional regulator [Thermoleophilaceae bacterium]
MTGLRAAELWGLPAPRTGTYTLAVISDEAALAERATESLEREGLQVRLVAAGAGAETLDELDRRPTLVIVRCPQDRRMLDRILRRAERRAAGAIVVVIVAEGERVDLGMLLANGADALVREEELGIALGPAVRAAACGQCSAPAGLLRMTQPPALSLRERQVLALALAGLSNAEIAERLYLAPSTVKTHMSAAFRRLGVHSRREATALVYASDDALQRSVRATLGISEEGLP